MEAINRGTAIIRENTVYSFYSFLLFTFTLIFSAFIPGL